MATALKEYVPTDSVRPPPASVSSPPFKGALQRHWLRWALLAGVIVTLVVAVQSWRVHLQNAIGYETVRVERGSVQSSVTATGTVNAVVYVLVGSQVSGNIKQLYADFNTKVTKGQLVALIDPQVFQTQVDQATAALASTHSAVMAGVAQVQKSTADLSGATASEKVAESVLAKDRATALNAANQYERQDGLFKAGIVSVQDYDLARATVDAAQAQVTADQSLIDAAKQTIQSAQAQVGAMHAALGSAQAQERQAQATLEQSKISLAHTRITAPVDGTVIARRMDVGQTVAASFAAPTIFEIAQDLTKMQLDASVDESDVGNIVVGQKATFTVDAYAATTFSGQVTAVRKAPINAQNVVTYDVVINVANPDLKLFPGMTANARILTAKQDNALKVPNSVMRVHPSVAMLAQVGLPPAPVGKQQLYILVGGKLRAVTATYGISDGKSTVVNEGDLREGDQVITRFTTSSSASAANTSSAPGANGARRGPGF